MLDQNSSQVELLTIGYEGVKIEEFLDTLLEAEVTVLLDIRELPLSRKKGFSKKSLQAAVEEAGIRYEHVRDLGDPKPGREAARSGNYKEFEKIFSTHLASEKAQSALTKLVPVAQSERMCLLCFERSHKHCHRTMVAKEFSKFVDITIRHIGVNCKIERKQTEKKQSTEAVILIKAAPVIGNKHGETVCCAGIDLYGNWLRLFPVSFRALENGKKFQRWDKVSFEWKMPSADQRPESRHIKSQTLEIIGSVKPA